MSNVTSRHVSDMLNKVPEVTLAFWIIKIMSTTVGETGADYLAVRAKIAESKGAGSELLKKEMQFEHDFVKAGGLLLSGEDPTGYGGALAGFGDQREVELLVEAGFTPMQAIHIATENGARFLGEDDRIGTLDALGEVAGVMRDAVFLGHRRGRVLVAAHERGDLNALDALQGIEMLLAKGALAGDANLHRHHFPLRTSRRVTRAAARLILGADLAFLPAAFARLRFSRMMCPTAVLEAGTV